MSKKCLLIDGSSLLFRAFYAIRELKTKDGIYTNGVYGFLSMYFNALKQYEPDYIMVAFDRKGPTFRTKEYEEYKANRQETPPELVHQFGIVKSILDAMNVKHLDMQDFEADDILGTISKEANARGVDTYLLTGDRDYLQLADDHVSIVYTKRGITETKEYTKESILEEYGVTPKQLIDVKGLMGDKSDNIPGIPGVGEKTALKLVKQFGSVEGVYEHFDEVTGKKLRENLEENEMTAYLSKRLGTIFTEVPMDIGLDDIAVQEPDREALAVQFDRYEFNTFRDNLNLDSTQEEVEMKADLVSEEEMVDLLKAHAKTEDPFYFKFFGEESFWHDNPEVLAIVHKQGVKYCFIQDGSLYAEIFQEIFENEDIQKITHDIKKDFVYLRKLGLDEFRNYLDLMLMDYLMDPSFSSYETSDLADRYLDRHAMTEEELLGKGAKKIRYEEAGDELKDFLGQNMFAMVKTRPILKEQLEERKMETLYYDIELPLAEVLSDLEFRGMPVDPEMLQKMGKSLDERIEKYQEEIYELAGEEFNVNSPKQLGEILFEKLDLPVIKKTKTGYSTNADVLDKLKSKHPIINLVLAYRSVTKLKSTYIDGLMSEIGEDHRIHSSFNQNVTTTGRISSTRPNLQNIPVRTEEGRLIRRAFIAPEGKKLVDADYSQIELRVLAHLAQDEKMLDAFKHGIDIHAKTASEVFHVPLEEVTPLQRSNAKAVNFGIVYGISDYGLSQDLDIPRKEAKAYIENYLSSYPKIKEYMDSIVEDAKKKGYVETIFHRRRYIPELSSRNYSIRSFGERVALNTPIQGSAADIIKIAMIRVYRALKKENLKSAIILQVHDELILETPDEEVERVKTLLKEEMESAADLSVKLVADMSVGENWDEAK